MKNYFLLTILTLITIISCEKDSIVSENQPLSEVENFVFDIDVSNQNGVISFGSPLDFQKYTEFTHVEREAMLDRLDFKSYSSFLTDLHKPFIDFTTEEQFIEYVNSVSEELEIITNSDNELEVSIKNNFNSYLSEVLSSDRILKVENEVFKYFDGLTVVANELHIDELKNLKLKETPFLNKEEFTLVTTTSNQVQTRAISEIECKLTNDNRWCKNDRRMKVFVDFGEMLFPAQGFQTFKSVKISALRKGIPCIWYSYSTIIDLHSISFESISHENLSHTWTEGSRRETTSAMVVTELYGPITADNYSDNSTFVIAEIVDLDVSATHQGMAGDDISCTY